MNAPDTKATGSVTALRCLQATLRHVRSNVVAYIAVGGSGSYALAAVGWEWVEAYRRWLR